MITSKNVEQFDYIPYTLPSLDMMVVANKKEAIKILGEANKYLADTIGHYARFYNEAFAWKEKNKANIRTQDLENIEENLKNLLTNITIVAGATVKITNATSDLSGETQRTDIKSTTGNGNDNDRDRTTSQIENTVGTIINNPEAPIDREAVDKALDGINNAIDGIVVRVPTPTIPTTVTRAPMTQEEKENIEKRTDLNNGLNTIKEQQKVMKELVDALGENPKSVNISKPDNPNVNGVKVTIDSGGVIHEITLKQDDFSSPFENPTDRMEAGQIAVDIGWDNIKEAATMPDGKKKTETITNGIRGVNVGLQRIEYEAEKQKEKIQQEINQQEKARDEATEKAKIEAEQNAAVADLNNLQTAIQQGTGSINNALDAINEAEQKGLISSEEAEKQREEVVEKAATALGMSEAEKESMKNDINESSKELNDKINNIKEQESKGEITSEQADKAIKEAQEQSKSQVESFVKDSITTSGSWGKGTVTQNPDGTTTWESTDSAGNTITTTIDKNGNGTVTTTTTDGMTHKDTVTGGKKDNNTSHSKTDVDSSGSNTGSGSGGSSGSSSNNDGPESGGSNTGL